MTALFILFVVALLALIVAVILYFYFRRKSAKAEEAPEQPDSDEISLLVHAAESKLVNARLPEGAKVGNLPVYLLMGNSGSTKTSVMVHSGLDPELLAGQVYQNLDIVPTRGANLWFSRRAVFAESAGKVLEDSAQWNRFVRRLRPRRSVVGSGGQAPRAAVVCFDSETFTKSGAQDAVLKSARALRARLGEICQAFGVNLPVYVLFTKLDRIRFFTEFVRNLSNDEVTQVFGATLPLHAGRSEGLHAQEETARLNTAFEQLFRSLADARLELLPRETEPGTLPSTYEFPREFRKIRGPVVQFLVELCRPSQLTAGPQLRGFYFTGVRPVIINEAAPAIAATTTTTHHGSGYGSVSDATSIFDPRRFAQSSAPAAQKQAVNTRRVPQWLFLGRLFTDIFLSDRAALGTSGVSTRTSYARRVLFIAAAALCLILSIGFTVSFIRNRGLESRLRTAAESLAAPDAPNTDPASAVNLQKLETLRQSLESLIKYQRNGAPLSLRMGLYSGDELYPEAWRIYFDNFRRLLFGRTQNAILASLQTLPPSPGPQYSPTYDALKAYLITTSNHDRSTVPFLSPVLMNWWANNRTVDAERRQLAQKQFDFYSDVLKDQNPYTAANDAIAIERARRYLNQFGGTERVYAAMLADAAKKNPAVNFNRQFQGTAEVVLETHEVPGAFSKNGWAFMKDAIQHADRYFSGEQWVLGNQPSANIDPVKLQQDLRTRYNADFIDHWRTYIKSASVVRYATFQDASQKLLLQSGNQSPLLELFSLATQNTDVDDPNVKTLFQPVQYVVPPGAGGQYIQKSNEDYINALVKLQAALDALPKGKTLTFDDAETAPVQVAASQAKVLTRMIALAFHPDSQGQLDAAVRKLLEDPITNLEKIGGGEDLNAAGAGLCAKLSSVFAKYPFNPKATAEATVPEVNALLRNPDGALRAFYTKNLQKLLVKQESTQQFVNPSGTLNPTFVNFFNAAAAFSDEVYAGGAQDPSFTYTLTPESSEGVKQVSLLIDGQSLSYVSGNSAMPKQLTWKGSGPHGVKASVNLGGPDLTFSTEQDAPWAVFHFFDEADRKPVANGQSLEWYLRIGGAKKDEFMLLPNGKRLTVRFALDSGTPPVFQPGFFSRLACVSKVTK